MAPNRPAPPLEPRAGFTFLEILVALAILGASFTVLLTAHSAALRQEGHARRLMIATLLGRELLTEVETEAAPEIGSDGGDFGEAFPGFQWERRVDDTEVPQLRQITLKVTWLEGSRTVFAEWVAYAVAEDEP